MKFTCPQVEKLDIRRDPDDANILYCTAYLKRRRKPFRYVAQHVEAEAIRVCRRRIPEAAADKDVWPMRKSSVAERIGLSGRIEGTGARLRNIGSVIACRAYRWHLEKLPVFAEWA